MEQVNSVKFYWRENFKREIPSFPVECMLSSLIYIPDKIIVNIYLAFICVYSDIMKDLKFYSTYKQPLSLVRILYSYTDKSI